MIYLTHFSHSYADRHLLKNTTSCVHLVNVYQYVVFKEYHIAIYNSIYSSKYSRYLSALPFQADFSSLAHFRKTWH